MSYRNAGNAYGKTCTIAFTKSSQVLFYNKTQFEKLGLQPSRTWNELVTVSKKAGRGHEKACHRV
ncbi:MAG: extracellular solute-binding protein [Sphaerochaeta sp.]|uniref:extracellular solute-binding protein n=1 Tax=Sphaerochaeta sp. TaxID=1972642 RepID=UPI003D0B612A